MTPFAQPMSTEYDIVIIGGGPVGATLALALRNSKLKICVLEARPAHSARNDARALALSYGSRLILSRLGIWDVLPEVSPIDTIHISQQHSFGRTVLRATEMNVPQLGYVLPYAVLQESLTQALQNNRAINCIYNALATGLSHSAGHAVIGYQQDGNAYTLRARLAVVADGGKLLLQQHPPKTRDYGQSALITHITCVAPQMNTAFERFTPNGPLALLPFQNGYALVWTTPHPVAQEMLGWSDVKFLDELHRQFGDRVGEFLTVGERVCFQLGLQRAAQQTQMPHTVLIGNAAQTLHPVAGQGFNIGLRDAWELARRIMDTAAEKLGSEEMLADYQKHRRIDREAGIQFTDGLVRLFSNDLTLLNTGRAAALTVLDCLPFAKRFVAKRMMFGVNG